ncbi:YutD family protein [Salibacterium aidingense]|uniref:YutD family protein n=1 Tax=Salibacterium aidingense TaxID=384933 RepID=UPI00042017F7|nr:YutD family protein [Salibacterium aidingense]
MIHIHGQDFELIEESRSGWDEDVFKDRYSEVLNKYDFIVGDWGHNQLRLRGFFDDSRKKVSYDSKISTLHDYLLEYCNFGCAYFVLKKIREE